MLEDQLRSIRKYYYNMPSQMRVLVGYLYGKLPNRVRYGKDFDVFSYLIDSTEYMSRDAIQVMQFKLLKETIRIAAEQIPYYQRVFAEYGVGARDLQAPADICKFPFLTKQDVKKHYRELINPNIAQALQLVTTTGGSTAEPMRFLQLKGTTRSKERAFILNGWNRIGYRSGDKAIQLKGRTVGFPDKGIHWEYEPIQNILEMDSSYLNESNIPRYLAEMRKFGAKFMIAFPSSLYLVAKFIANEGIEPPEFKAIMLASENVYPWQREEIEKVFGCRAFSHYGHSEMVLLGMESDHSRELLFFPQYGYLELMDEQNNAINGVGESGELVGTSFHNPVMPLIRYRTQDRGTLGGSSNEKRHYPVLSEIEGRLQEFILTRDHRFISVTTLGAAHFDILDNVFATQYYQDEMGVLVFRVVPRQGYTSRDRDLILRALTHKLGRDVRVEVQEVPDIQRTLSGKHLMLIQKLDLTKAGLGYSDNNLAAVTTM